MKFKSFVKILMGLTAARAFYLPACPSISAAQSISLRGDAYQNHAVNTASVGKQVEAQADSIVPDSSQMGALTSVELAQELVPGWNLGNSLDAIGGETAWGNPATTQRLIDSVKAAGFRSVRIPVAWSSHFTDTSTYTIDSTWMARVEQVVGYVLKDSMYAVINEHWDGGWQQPTHADSAYVNNRLAAMWRQIAVHFRDYGNHLLFAGTNEIMITGNYNTPTVEYYTVQNSFNRTFVNTVRATGGRNYYRYLFVQGFNTNIDYTVSFLSVPSDVVENRLMVEVHYYDPYNFTLNINSAITQWGRYATDPARTETWANESYADGQFRKMKNTFIDHGYGVILGEYGAIARLSLGSPALNAQYESYRRYYMQYITRSLERHGLVPMYWDNGYTGNSGLGIFDRSTGTRVYPDIINAVVDTGRVDSVTGISESSRRPSSLFLGQNYPNPFNPATEISYSIPKAGFATLKVYNVLGQEVATLFSGMRQPGNYVATFDAGKSASGIYFYRLTFGGSSIAKKMILMR